MQLKLQYFYNISSDFAIWRSFLFSHVATLVYDVHEICICLGRGGGSSGPSQEHFEMKW